MRACRRNKIGFIFQQHNLRPLLTTLEHVALMLQINGLTRRESKCRANDPPAALDTQRGTKVMAMLRQIARERHSAVIAVTHDHRMIEGFDGRLAHVDHHAQVVG